MVGNERSGDLPGHPFRGNQYSGVGKEGKSKNQSPAMKKWNKYKGPNSPAAPATDTTTKNKWVRDVVKDLHNKNFYNDAKVEHMHVVKQGKLIDVAHGSSMGVTPNDINKIEDTDVTHNHPSGYASLSAGDLSMTMVLNGLTITAQTPDGRYMTAFRPENGWEDTIKKVTGKKFDPTKKMDFAHDIKWAIIGKREDVLTDLENTKWYEDLRTRVKNKEITADEKDIIIAQETARKYYRDELGLEVEEGII